MRRGAAVGGHRICLPEPILRQVAMMPKKDSRELAVFRRQKQLGRIPCCFGHGSILSKVGVSTLPGAVHGVQSNLPRASESVDRVAPDREKDKARTAGWCVASQVSPLGGPLNVIAAVGP